MDVRIKFSLNILKTIEKDEHRKFVKFHNLVEHQSESDAFWMRHGVPVAMVQLRNPPLVKTIIFA
jgi:hypothetical protein